jgi:hypothetical protein
VVDIAGKLARKMELLLNEVPREERGGVMYECVSLAGDYLYSQPSYTDPQSFSESLFSDHGIRHLARNPRNARNALAAESPQEVILWLLPSDGHLE